MRSALLVSVIAALAANAMPLDGPGHNGIGHAHGLQKGNGPWNGNGPNVNGDAVEPRRCKPKHSAEPSPSLPISYTTSPSAEPQLTEAPVSSSYIVSEAVPTASASLSEEVPVPSEAAPSEAAPSEAAPSEAAPSEAAPSEAASSETAPSEAAPSEAASSEAAPSVSVSETPEEPEVTPSASATPSSAAPSEAAPSEAVASEVASAVETASAEPSETATPSVEPSEAAPSASATAEPEAEEGKPVIELAVGETSSYAGEILTLHNNLRRQFGAVDLVWDEGLAQSAAAWSSQCVWGHSGSGENLAAGSFGWFSLSDLFSMWAAEEEFFNWAEPQYTGLWDAANNRNGVVGHFTQVVWKSTTKVGCAWTHCKAGTIQGDETLHLVCQYDPDGNVVTTSSGLDPMFQKNVGPAV